MTGETIDAINKYCDAYGDKLIELMERCGVMNTTSVPEEKALAFLEELKTAAKAEQTDPVLQDTSHS